jgi:ribosome-associated translation inhibitor RaiA
VQEVAEKLLAEGLQLFSEAFDKLLEAVEKQSRRFKQKRPLTPTPQRRKGRP